MIAHVFLYIVAFVGMWFGAGLIVASTTSFARRLRLSAFVVSFILLGLLTSTPEFAVGLQAVAQHDPEIFVGNLLGGIIVLFLLIIPLLAVFGNGISLKHTLDEKLLIATFAVILAPSIAVLDHRVTNIEGLTLIVLYFILIFLVQRKDGFFDKENTHVLDIRAYSYKDVLKIMLGMATVFVASTIIVEKTLYFAQALSISAFYISLVFVSLGTNIPELSLAIRSVILGKKDIALGDYMGSAAVNTVLFGLFTLLHNGEVLTVNSFYITFAFIATALGLFYVFSKTKKTLSRREGFVLLILYFIFVGFELTR